MENQRNLILAVVLTGLLLFGWQTGMEYLYPQANKPKPVVTAASTTTEGTSVQKGAAKHTREGGLMDEADSMGCGRTRLTRRIRQRLLELALARGVDLKLAG